MKIKLLHELAKVPTKGSADAAGYDLFAIEHATIAPGRRAKLRTGICLQMEHDTVGLIWPRSKLASVYGIHVLGGVIDCDYRGEIMISILNGGQTSFEVKQGDRIAQLIFQQCLNRYTFDQVNKLDDTIRGKAGINDFELRL